MPIWKRWFGGRAPEEPADGGDRSIFSLLGAWDGAGDPPDVVRDPDGSSPDATRGAEPPGAADAALLARGRRPGDDEEEAIPILAPFRRACRSAEESHFRDLYEAARVSRIAALWEPFLERVRGSAGITPAAMRALARRLRRRAAHAESAKLGILLATALRDGEAVEEVKVLGRHEEFGFWCVQALSAILPDPVEAVWDLARRHRGWGKIHAVRRLALEAKRRPDVRAWLLRHGCENAIAPTHLAAVCAAAGTLDDALRSPRVDDELLDGAATILAGMFVPQSPGPTWRNWRAAPEAAKAFLERVAERASTPSRRLAVEAIRGIVGALDSLAGSPPDDPEARDEWLDRRLALEDAGWTPDLARDLRTRCERLLGVETTGTA